MPRRMDREGEVMAGMTGGGYRSFPATILVRPDATRHRGTDCLCVSDHLVFLSLHAHMS